MRLPSFDRNPPAIPALTGRLEQSGYSVELLADDPDARNGPSITLAARADGIPGRGI